MSDDTEIIEKKAPLLMPILRYLVRGIEYAIISAVIAGCHYIDSHKEQQDVKWIGQHLQQKANK